MFFKFCAILSLAVACLSTPALANQATTTSPAPQSREIEGLKAIADLEAAIASYRAIAAAGGWTEISAGKPLKPGISHPRIEALRARLAVSGDAQPSSGPLYDDALAEAVQRFQTRHGLEPDAVVGGKTLRALNFPVEQRIQTLELNLARMQRETWGDRYIAVNIPEAVYRHVDGGVAKSGPAVIGQPGWETPELDSVIDHLEFNPTWTVPAGIAAREIWPKIEKDPGYLARNDMQIIDGKIRQAAGPKNPLGRVKFLFDNAYSVYLHDTNHPEFFTSHERDRSHGCVRVFEPIDLAGALLSLDPEWPRSRIDDVLKSGKTTRIGLASPIQVHIVYLTAWVAADGTVEFRPDIYGRDRGKRSKPAKTGLYGD